MASGRGGGWVGLGLGLGSHCSRLRGQVDEGLAPPGGKFGCRVCGGPGGVRGGSAEPEVRSPGPHPARLSIRVQGLKHVREQK